MSMLENVKKSIWRFRKAFLTKFFQINFSQFGEDIILFELLKKDINKGFFVDIGCFHPKKYSNTYRLYKNGWRGINIDMEEDKIALFNLARPHDWNIQSAISDKSEIVTIYRYSKFGLGSTINPDFAAKTKDIIFDTQVIQTKTINTIIEESPYQGRQIDMLSIDVEGMDYRVIKSLNFEMYQPKIIIVEDHHRRIGEILETEIYQLLKSKGYQLRSWTFYSLIFIFPMADILKTREVE